MRDDWTFGQIAVEQFTKGDSDGVYDIKLEFADAIDLLHEFQINSKSNEAKEIASIAIREAQSACMWAVKALKWRDA